MQWDGNPLMNKIMSILSNNNASSAPYYSFLTRGEQDERKNDIYANRSLADAFEQIISHFTFTENTLWSVTVSLFYLLIVVISFFGNFIVCRIVFKSSLMRSTTNIYIGNLSLSDLLMTVINIPLQLTKILCQDWPLGIFACKFMPFFHGLSVNVSAFTITCIALDRHQVIAYPMKPRSGLTAIFLKIVIIWLLAMLASLPYPLMADIGVDKTTKSIIRCRLIYPDPAIESRKLLTLITLLVQYIIPLTITGVSYCKICLILFRRKSIGSVTESQRIHQRAAKWVTIKMLLIVYLVFTLSWLPLNAYHTYNDFMGLVGPTKHSSTIFLVCHWIAMSSVCYNPFIYCWLNETFRRIAVINIKWVMRCKCCGLAFRSLRNSLKPTIRFKKSLSRTFSSVTKTASCSVNSQHSSHLTQAPAADDCLDFENEITEPDQSEVEPSSSTANESKNSFSVQTLPAIIELNEVVSANIQCMNDKEESNV